MHIESDKALPLLPSAAGMLDWLKRAAGGTYGLCIDGRWETTATTSAVFNPARPNESLGTFAEATAADADRAVAAAQAAFGPWSQFPGPERGALLFRAAELIDRSQGELAYIIAAEQGKVLAEALGEVTRAVKELRFAAGEASRSEGMTLPSEKRQGLAMTIREPIGVIAAITPWNFPFVTPIRKVGPALAYGCTVVLKPSQITPWSAVRLVELFHEAGVPPGVLNLLTGSGAKVGDTLVRDRRVAGISFTGSTGVGTAINGTAALRLARTQLELGGKNAAVVLGYSDAGDVARQIVSAAFTCGGQRCTSVSRVIVTRALADEFRQALIAAMSTLKLGPAWDPDAKMGPMITKAHRAGVLAALDKATAEGARVAYSGPDQTERDGHFIAATLLDGVLPTMSAARDEIFGPVLSMLVVDDLEEALRVANDVAYGLAASVFTLDFMEAMAFARGSQTGMVHINHGTNSESHMPFGGIKASGSGAFSIGHSNQDFYTNSKTVYAV